MIWALLASLGSGLGGTGSAGGGLLSQGLGAAAKNFGKNVAKGTVSPSSSSHAQKGRDYVQAPDMSNYASIASLNQMLPQRSRASENESQMSLLSPKFYQNPYMTKLLGG